MENPHALMEYRLRVAGAILVGGVALSGCTAGPNETPDDRPAYTYEAAPGVDELPRVSGYNLAPAPGADVYVDNSILNYHVDNQPGKEDYQKYTTVTNNDPKTKKTIDEMPFIDSAPVLDIMMGSDGELRYKDYFPGQADDQDAKIIRAVAATSDLLKPALHSGDVNTVHIRINELEDPEELAEFGPNPDRADSAQFVGHDTNDGGEPSIYYFMSPDGMTDTQTIATEIGHETGHALKHQVNPEDGKDINLTGEEEQMFVEACTVMKQNAIDHIKDESFYIVSDLEKLRDMSKPQFHKAYDTVINAIENGSFGELPTFQEPAGAVPECFLQNPWRAFLAQVKTSNIDDRLRNPDDLGEYEDAVGDIFDEWNDLQKQGGIFEAISESTYLKQDDDHSRWGHPENVYEIGASLTNVMLQMPKDFGDNVSELDAAQRAVTIKLVQGNAESLKNSHKEEADFCKFVDAQVAAFVQSANIPK